MCLQRTLALFLFCLSIGMVGCQRPDSGCDDYLIEIVDLQLDASERPPTGLRALVRLDGSPWFSTKPSSFPVTAHKWSFCAPALPPGAHELRVTLVATDDKENDLLGAEFNPTQYGPHSTANRLTHVDRVTLRRPKVCNKQGWCWENPLPQGSTLFGTASRDAGSVWAVGDAGTVLHWNGGFWQRLDLRASGTGFKIWVDERDYAWVMVLPDKLYRCSNLECRQIGAAGSPEFAQLFGFDASHAFAVGKNGSLYACSQSDCRQLNSTVSTNLNRGLAVASDVAYVVGSSGVLLRCQGNDCTTIPTGTTEPLWALAKGPDGRLHVVGGKGTYLLCNDLGCAPRSSGTLATLDKIEVLADGGSVLVGTEATVVSCDSKDCRVLSVPKGLLLTGLFAPSRGSAWISAREDLNPIDGIYRGWVLRCDETYCSQEYMVPQYNGHLLAIGGSDANNIWAVGYLGVMVECSEDRGCKARSSGSTKTFTSISGDAHLAWAAGQDGAVVRCVEGFGCSEFSSGTSSWFWGGGGSSGQHWAVGRNGVAASCDASGCQALPTATGQILTSVWPIDDNSVWVAGGGQVILRCTATRCTTVRPEGPGNANGIWGTELDNTWVVGGYTEGTVYRCGGAGCTQIHTDRLTSEFLAVSGASPDAVWAVGQVGGIARCTKSACTNVPSGVSTQLAAVWTPTPEIAWVTGAEGVILRCEGSSCRRIASGTDKYLGSIAGVGDRFWIVGHQGTMLRCQKDRCDAVTKLTPSSVGPILIPDETSGWLAGGGGAVFRYYPERAID
ncbi:MAG TPA: hypothetical protein PKI03_03355 [Pseudomonadota bacterium]|nr:hypothetical protein [Pseudomonadota bacterium]